MSPQPREYPQVQPAQLREALRLGCFWLTERSQVQDDVLSGEANSHHFTYTHWRGAFRGEYVAATRTWDFFCPIWHGGQAVKALALAYRELGDERLLDAARLGAAFILDKQTRNAQDEDHGLILAYEDYADRVNTSAILECLDGLFHLTETSGDYQYQRAGLDALGWVARKAYIPGEGLFRDSYNPVERRFVPWQTRNSPRPLAPGRPLLEDGVFLKGSRLAERPEWRTAFFETAERLLTEEDPPGNWMHFKPANALRGVIHPRHAYWWGMPMIDAWQESGKSRYLDCARRAADWYVRAQRHDGGLLRNTYLDFNTDSFGHETSGIACAAVFWQKMQQATGITDYDGPIQLALDYCQKVQFTRPTDENLRGAILSKVLPPDGSDRSPYHLRDLGTILFHPGRGNVARPASLIAYPCSSQRDAAR